MSRDLRIILILKARMNPLTRSILRFVLNIGNCLTNHQGRLAMLKED